MNRTDASPFLDRVISWSLDHPLKGPTRYIVATLPIVAIALFRAAFVTALLPWLLFIPGILLVGLLLGRGAGFYATGLSAVFAAFSIAAPGAALWLTAPQWSASLLFCLVGAGIVVLAAELRSAFRRARLLVTERETANLALLARDAQRDLLNREMVHRMKNLLTVVQAVVGPTLRRSSDLRQANDAIGARLAAIGKATAALTASEWRAADLYSLADEALGAHDGNSGRFTIEGPPVLLDAQLALAFTLTFHELITNATKYGALSNDGGHIGITWDVSDGANAQERRFQLVWCEKGGPFVTQPSRRGFGSTMIERTLRSYLRGVTSIEYHPEGLVFRIDAPLPGVAEGAAE